MNFRPQYLLFALLLLPFSLSAQADWKRKKITEDEHLKTESKLHFFINEFGDTIPTGVFIPTVGKKIHPNLVAEPRPSHLFDKRLIQPAHSNVHPAEIPKMVPVPKNLRTIIPGKEGVRLPKTVPAQPKMVATIQARSAPASKPSFKETAIADIRYLDYDHGLISHTIRSILEDSRGNLWLGGQGTGVSRYDGNSITHYTNKEGLSGNVVLSMLEDSQGNLWFGTETGGVSRYDGRNFSHFTSKEGLPNNMILSMLEDSRGNLWLGTGGGGLCLYDGANFHHFTIGKGQGSQDFQCMLEDSKGNLWFGTGKGVWRYEPDTIAFQDRFTHFTTKEGLINNNVLSMLEDSRGDLWFLTWQGVCRYRSKPPTGQATFTHYTTEEGLIANNTRGKILEDKQGNIWIGSGKGISRYDPYANHGQGSFTHYTTEEGLSKNYIYSIWQDSRDNLWFGTFGGGLSRYSSNGFVYYNLQKGTGNNAIRSILEDSRGKMWFGTLSRAINQYDPADEDTNGGHFILYHLDQPGLGVESGYIRSMLEDSHGNLWFGRMREGVNRYDLTDINQEKVGFKGFNYRKRQGLSGNDIWSMLEDRQGNLWFASLDNGLTRMEPKTEMREAGFTQFTVKEGLISNSIWVRLEDSRGNIWLTSKTQGITRYTPEADGHAAGFIHYSTEEGLLSNAVNCIIEDSNKHLWIGTDEGLSYYRPLEGEEHVIGQRLAHYTAEDGLIDNYVASIIEDRQQNIWVATNRGIAVLKPIAIESTPSSSVNYKLISFSKANGLGQIGFIKNIVYLDRSDRIWWGTNEGLVRLDLKEFEIPSSRPEIAINTLEINQSHIDYRRLQDSVYRNQIDIGENLLGTFDSVPPFYNYPVHLSLPYHLNHLTFEISAIDWTAPGMVQYSYFLQGLDEHWSTTKPDRKANYPRLPPGNYVFKAKAMGPAKIWSDVLEYPFVIRSPWWLTWWAFVLYGLLAGFLLYRIYRFLLVRQLAREEMERVHELNTFKTRLYTNITHEFRTPLTIIQGTTEQIQAHPKEKEIINRNSQNLLDLVNSLLDMAKLEAGRLPLRMIHGDILHFLRYVSESFHSLAINQKINLNFYAHSDKIEMNYDPEKMLQILSNLISNAIKFTREYGKISIIAQKKIVAEIPSLLISVEDTGIGISDQDLPHIFKLYHQSDAGPTRQAEGTGIGLALTKELVELMDGEIQVESQAGEGSVFSVLLPIHHGAPEVDVPTNFPKAASTTSKTSTPERHTKQEANFLGVGSGQQPLLLIAEDNKDVRNYLASCLRQSYQLLFARNGREGIDLALEHLPDIIISDVMMPEADGFELCRVLKQNERSNHIPIILLTAKADMASKLEGLEFGADAYLIKPFHRKELDIRLRKLIEIRQKLHRKYQQADFSIGTSTEKEDAFIIKARQLVLAHLDDPEFGIKELSEGLFLHRSHLHRKLKALSGKSGSHFIRMIRLQQAFKLLQKGELNVSEVAFAVGFADPAYFSKLFSKEFGRPPSQIIGENS